MVSFGDSLSDGGNLRSLLPSISERTAQYLTGWDPAYYYDYRFSNGPIWVDYLYTSLGFGDIGSMGANDGGSNINGTNFSWVGSRSGTGTSGGLFQNLQSQIGFYSNQLAVNNPYLPDPGTTLFTIWSGANDVFAHVENGDPVTPAQVVGNIVTAIADLYAEGGRYFVVPNLPPIGQMPFYINELTKGGFANAFVNSFNAMLDDELGVLSGSLEGITVFKVDIHGLFLEIMADPEVYGFNNITDAAYIRYGEYPYVPRDPPYGTLTPNSEGYFFWDAMHGTTAANAFIAQAAYGAVVPEPSVMTLFLGAGTLAVAFARYRRRNRCVLLIK